MSKILNNPNLIQQPQLLGLLELYLQIDFRPLKAFRLFEYPEENPGTITV